MADNLHDMPTMQRVKSARYARHEGRECNGATKPVTTALALYNPELARMNAHYALKAPPILDGKEYRRDSLQQQWPTGGFIILAYHLSTMVHLPCIDGAPKLASMKRATVYADYESAEAARAAASVGAYGELFGFELASARIATGELAQYNARG